MKQYEKLQAQHEILSELEKEMRYQAGWKQIVLKRIEISNKKTKLLSQQYKNQKEKRNAA